MYGQIKNDSHVYFGFSEEPSYHRPSEGVKEKPVLRCFQRCASFSSLCCIGEDSQSNHDQLFVVLPSSKGLLQSYFRL